MTTKRILESGTIKPEDDGTIRVCLISEGEGSSAKFPRDFFTQANADVLAGSLSFPAHPIDPEHPEMRDPMSAIGQIAEAVTIEEHDGLMGFWSRYMPAKSKPQVGPYLKEFGHKLGLSIFADSEGHAEAGTGRWIAEALVAGDPYKSVDLVVAAGARGKFERVSESLGLITKTSAPAGENEVVMDKDVKDAFDVLNEKVGKLVEALEGKAKADLQVQANDDEVKKTVESRLAECAKVETALVAAKLTDTQNADFRKRAAEGATLAELEPDIASAQKVIEDARQGYVPEDPEGGGGTHKVTENYIGDDKNKGADFSVDIPGFGSVN